MTQIPDAPITQAAYARHRAATGLPGATKVAVGRAVKAGRLSESLVMVDGVARVRDIALADREWEANTDVSMRLRAQGFNQPPAALAAVMPRAASPAPTIDAPLAAEPDGPADFQTARLQKERAQAAHAELKYREHAGTLIPAADVENQLTSYISSCKTRLLAIPSRAKQDLPHLPAADLVVLEGLVREALEELAGPVGE